MISLDENGNVRHQPPKARPASGRPRRDGSSTCEPRSQEPAFADLTPLVSSLADDRRLRNAKPLAGLFLPMRLHATTSSVPTADALIAWGLDPADCVFFTKPYPYAHGD